MMTRTFVSFSGGRSSGLMAKMMKDRQRETGEEMIFGFANTGEEDERTLRFVDRCDKHFGLELVWVEAVVHRDERKGSTHKVVDFKSASRNGEPFEDVVSKYGLPNKSYPHCNRELKLAPMHSYLRSVGWEPGTYDTALGIRADEADRRSKKAKEKRLVYPLIKAFIRKPEVYSFWKQQPFDLYLPEHRGNCKWCWKKSLRKHLTLAVDYPEVFDFPRRLETYYSGVKPERGPQAIFRQEMTVAEIFERSKQPFVKFRDGREAFDPELDASGGGCGTDSCEIDGDDDDLIDLFTRRTV
jgi:hypothetical protein